MRVVYRILKVLLGVLFLAFLLVFSYVYFSAPDIPEKAERIFDEAIKSEVTERIHGHTGTVVSQGVSIWYESIEPKDSVRGTVLLIMGIANDALAWPDEFIDAFSQAGYRVVRYDHRGTGMSDWVEDWTPETAYSLVDMAEDCMAVLNALSVEKAHLVGISMGGMIAQELLIRYPSRVASLASIMSSGNIFDPGLKPISRVVAFRLLTAYARYGIIGGEKNLIKLNLSCRMILRGQATYGFNYRAIAEETLYRTRKRRGFNFNVSKQHQAAVYLSGSRYGKLKETNVPVLVVHGKNDPFIPIAHGKKCAAIIPTADSLWLDGFSHDIPVCFVDTLSTRIIANFQRSSSSEKLK